MKASELKSVLHDLAGLMRAGSAKRQAADVQLLAERIDDAGGKSVGDALDKFESEIAPAAQPTPLSPQRYIREFKAAGLDEVAFKKIFAQYRVDKNIKKADAMTVMHGYVGDYKRAKTKTQAVDEVKRRFNQLVYDDNSRRQAASTTPW